MSLEKALKTVYIEHSSMAYQDMFKRMGFTVVHSPEAADILCFTGGADVTPAMYGDAKHRATGNDPYRDAKEKRLYDWAIENRKPMVGICRGGQFLNVMSGGRMYQDVTEHCGDHDIVDVETGEVFYVSSTHHQMMMPSADASIVATSTNRGAREWFDQEMFRRDVSDTDYEVVFYPSTQCLCFQPHPEFSDNVYAGMHSYFAALLNRFFNIKG